MEALQPSTTPPAGRHRVFMRKKILDTRFFEGFLMERTRCCACICVTAPVGRRLRRPPVACSSLAFQNIFYCTHCITLCLCATLLSSLAWFCSGGDGDSLFPFFPPPLFFPCLLRSPWGRLAMFASSALYLAMSDLRRVSSSWTAARFDGARPKVELGALEPRSASQ